MKLLAILVSLGVTIAGLVTNNAMIVALLLPIFLVLLHELHYHND